MSDNSSIAALLERRKAILAEEPKLRARNLAEKLGISEAELVALGSAQATVTRLRPEWTAIIGAVGGLGRVMALTRNESVVHERKGVYGALEGFFALAAGAISSGLASVAKRAMRSSKAAVSVLSVW